MDYSFLSPKWQERFKFFDTYGSPATPEYKDALAQADFKTKLKINMNFIAFFFGFIYFFVLGLWRKNLAIFGISIVVVFTLGLFLPPSIMQGINVGICALYGMTANYARYLHVVKNSTSWNPFEGMFKS